MYYEKNDNENNKDKKIIEIEEKIDHYSSETADKIASFLAKLACLESLMTATVIIGLNLTIFLMATIVFSTLDTIFTKNIFRGISFNFENIQLKNVSYVACLILSISALSYVRHLTKSK